MISTEYKDYEIRYSESTDKWEVQAFYSYDDHGDGFDTLTKAKKYIDKKLKVKYAEQQVIYVNYGNFIEHGIVTATRPHKGYTKLSFWIKNESGTRSTITTPLYLNTPENQKIISDIIDIEKQIDNLEEDKRNLVSRLKVLKELEEVK